jgi:outer membrane protein TolC
LQALEAEIEALRAARAAEVAQMGDIVDTLDRLVGGDPAGAGPAVAEEAAELDQERG